MTSSEIVSIDRRQTGQPCNENHTIGIWWREGHYMIVQCNCGYWWQKIDIDTPAAYKVFECESALALDGKPVDEDAAEKLKQSQEAKS